MIAPPPFFCISGAARPVPRMTACRSISITRRHRSGGASGKPGAPTPMPALLCRMSRRPNFDTAVSIIWRASSSSGDVRLHKNGTSAGVLDSLDGFCAAGFVEIGDHNRGAFFRQALGRCTPDPR